MATLPLEYLYFGGTFLLLGLLTFIGIRYFYSCKHKIQT